MTLPSRLLRSLAPLLVSAGLAACGSEPAGPEMDSGDGPVGVILGRAYAPTSADFTGVVARVRWGSTEATSALNADGTFAVPLLDSVQGFGQLTLEPGPGVGLNPAWVLLTPGDLQGQGSVVLVPDRWRIERGEFAGAEVDIHPDQAADTRVLPSFWGSFFPFRQEGFLQTIVDNTIWTGAFQTWPASRFPIPAALDRVGSTAELTTADSLTFWGHVERLEEALGRDVFRPVPIDDVQILGGTRRALGAVLVQVDSTLPTRGEGDVDAPNPWSWTLSADASTWSGGPVTRIGFISADVVGGRVAVVDREALGDRSLVLHELMHVLGAGHGCSWPSIQTYCASLRTDLPTAQDVAYLEVLEAVRALEDEVGTRWGLVSSITGTRVVRLGLPPVPAPSLVYGPGNAAPAGT